MSRAFAYGPALDSLNDLPAESRREVASAVAAVLSVSTEDAETIVRASEPLWGAMEEVSGLVDSWGCGEFCHLFPKMCTVLKPTDD